MRKAILMMLLVVMSNSAVAEWVAVSSYDNDTYYVDFATIRKVGNMVKMWHLYDLQVADKTALGIPYMSMRVQSELTARMRNREYFLHLCTLKIWPGVA